MKRVFFIFVTDFKGTSLTSSKPQLCKTVVNDSELVSTELKGRKGWHIKDTASFRGLVQQFISLTNASEGNFQTMRCLVAFLCKRFTAAATGNTPSRGRPRGLVVVHAHLYLSRYIVRRFLDLPLCDWLYGYAIRKRIFFSLMSPISSSGHAVAQIDSQKTLFRPYIYFFLMYFDEAKRIGGQFSIMHKLYVTKYIHIGVFFNIDELLSCCNLTVES